MNIDRNLAYKFRILRKQAPKSGQRTVTQQRRGTLGVWQ